MNKRLSANESSVEKALNILLAFTPHSAAFTPHTTEMGTTELSLRLGMHKSTTSRLIQTLVSGGYLQQNPATKKYALGRSCYVIGYTAMRSLDSRLMAIAQPFLAELAQETGESIALEVLTGLDVILAMQVEGPSHLRFNFRQGELVPINVAAGAKAILAYSDPSLVESFLHRKFEQFNERTITTKQEYRQMLAEVRKEGIAYDRGERYEDIFAMAIPIFTPAGPPVAAVILAGPSSRLTDDFFQRMAPPLKSAAKNIEKHMYQ